MDALKGVRDEVEWIKAELTRIQYFLKDVDEKRKRNSNVRTWLMDITDVAYDAEDLMEAITLKKFKRSRLGLVKRYGFIINYFIFLDEVGTKITQIKARIKSIAERRASYNIENISDQESSFARQNLQEQRRSSAHIAFNIEEIMGEIEKQVNISSERKAEMAMEGSVYERVYEFLSKYSYLIVMDDIWTREVWTRLQLYFPNTKSRSRIIFTTRYQETKDLTVDAWSRVLDSLNWHLDQDGTCQAILALSYYDLPFYLKSCFLYLGLFPEGYKIPVRRLIRLWIAEGFVQKRGEECLEDVGKDYIEELVGRNIIQVANRCCLSIYTPKEIEEKNRGAEVEGKSEIETSSVGREQVADGGNLSQECLTCHVHDLVRELSLSIAKEHQFLHVHKTNCNNTSSDGGRARRLVVHQDFGSSSSSQASIQHLRSYLHFDLCESEMSQKMGDIFRTKQGYKWLRVLDLEGTYKPLLPKALGKLVHLRYLGLRRTWLDSLPSSFGDLFNLQTLDLKWTSIKSLPSSISRMENLRHLYFNWGKCSTDLLHQPNHISLNNLQTLWGVLVPQGTSATFLDQCINLGKLGMEGELMSHGEELAWWLGSLDRLQSLKLCSAALPALMLLRKVHLVKLHLEGRLEKL
ncbi:hypothetical protein GIB67_036614 [Kingdonia uniflora]|uniref:Uncharacterized protein n=1 Tax=Kingdonia uniflora TaxID=39325 RepID=A0A7J7M0J7_9MAGN|nr:hypothetical protein GIB67_036614 [Kingdonia uniflora]